MPLKRVTTPKSFQSFRDCFECIATESCLTLCGSRPARSAVSRTVRWLPRTLTNSVMAKAWASRPTTTELRPCATTATLTLTKGKPLASRKGLMLGMRPTAKPLDGYLRWVTSLCNSFPEALDVSGDVNLSLSNGA